MDNKTVEWRVYPVTTREILIKQLVWERHIAPNHKMVTAICNEDIHKWGIATRDLDPSNLLIAALKVSLSALLIDRQQR